MNHKRILVALEFADSRDPAFERALALARTSGSELYLLHAIPANERFSARATLRLQHWAALRERAEAAGVGVQTVEQQGDPAEIIVLHADARPVDLIVMGTERRTGWARFRQPSVAERVLRRTTRPTLVVGDEDAGDGSGFKSVLVAVDMSPASRPLFDTAVQLTGDDVRQLTVVHVVDSFEAARAERTYRGHLRSAARRRLAAVMPARVGSGARVQIRVAVGLAADTIGAHAADVSADLIVVGRSWRFMHLGSTAVRMLRDTNRALLVVPPTATASQTIDARKSLHQVAA